MFILRTYSVTINIVLMDNTGKPVDALISSKEIQESGAVEQLKVATGLQVASVSALDDEPRPGGSQGSGSLKHIYYLILKTHAKPMHV